MRDIKDKQKMARAYHFAANEIGRKKNLSQDGVADAIGIKRDALNRLKMGYTTVKESDLEKAEAALPGFRALYNQILEGSDIDYSKQLAEMKQFFEKIINEKTEENKDLRNMLSQALCKALGQDENQS